MKEINMWIAQNLIDYRKRNKLTQIELAERLNYTDKAVSKWEHGDSIPGVDVLVQICQIYGISLNDLVREPGTPPPEPEIVPQQTVPAQAVSRQENQKHISITLLSVLIVWFLASLIYVSLNVFGRWNIWILFCWAVPASAIILIVFNCIWGKMNRTYVLVSVLVWTLLLCFCLQFLKYNIWMLLVIGVPLQIGVLLWYSLDKARRMPQDTPDLQPADASPAK